MSNNPFGACFEPECSDTPPSPELPSTLEMMRGLFRSGKSIIDGVIAHEGLLVEDDVMASRLSVCEACPLYIAETKRCSKCGCYMEKKTMFKKTVCPVGKW